MASVLNYLTLAVFALGGVVLLRGILVMPRFGPRLGGWCALLSGFGMTMLLLPTVPVDPHAGRNGPEVMLLDIALSIWAALALMLALRGVFRLDESPRGEPAADVGWMGFRLGLPTAALMAGLVVAMERGRDGSDGSSVAAWSQAGLALDRQDALRVVGLVCLAIGAGIVPGLVRRRVVVHEAMLTAGVLGVPCCAYAALRVAAESPKEPLLHELAGPAAIGAVCGVLLSALYVRRWQLALEEAEAEDLGEDPA